MNFYTRRVTLPVITPIALQKRVIKVFGEDHTSRAVEVHGDITARDLCQLFALKNQCVNDHSWTLFEQLTHLGIATTAQERNVFPDRSCRPLFLEMSVQIPSSVLIVGFRHRSSGLSSASLSTFLNSNSCPEICGHLHARDQGKKSWKKFYFVLRRSGLYFSSKGTSKEPRHLQFLAELSGSHIYTLLSARKSYGAPTDYGFCIKPTRSDSPRDLKVLCAEEEQLRTCWVTAMRLFKYGTQLYQNFLQPHQKQEASPTRSVSENCLVAMDFSGQKSRVIENPLEALTVAAEEGLSWRYRVRSHPNTAAAWDPPARPHALLSPTAVHRAQPWFYSSTSRDEAQRLIAHQGLADGVFLVRDSQSSPRTFVLSLCHKQRVKHFQILPVESEGELFFSLDDGQTRFTDLIQLVDFYQLNRGVLPCKLKHQCCRVTL
ncbi:growth factor receptor-bound protein 14-like [Arapaima gigas]